MVLKTDSEPLNRLRTVIRANAHLLSVDDINELNDAYKELIEEYQAFENEVSMNEQLLGELETLKTRDKQTN